MHGQRNIKTPQILQNENVSLLSAVHQCLDTTITTYISLYMLNTRQQENETGGIADASLDASFSVSVSSRGSGAA
jgi:hypothetical protein